MDPKVDKIYAGDIFAAVDIMNDLNERITYLMKNITKDELINFLEVNTSHIICRISTAVDIMNDLNERITYLMKNITKDELMNFLEVNTSHIICRISTRDATP